MEERHSDERADVRTATSTGPHADHRDGFADPSDGSLEPSDGRAVTSVDRGERHDPGGRLLRDAERSELRERWDALQGRFVDDPHESTRLADELLHDTRERVGRAWEERHRDLADWRSHDDNTTEDLRTSMRRYRDLFERLLSS